MLRQVRIRNLGVIDDAVLDLEPGLNVLTGETGAGKTMVVTGLGLLLGGRSDAGLVRAGAAATIVEGLLGVPASHPAAARVREAGGDADDEIVLARTVSEAGRSRAYVGGRAAPVGLLAELGELLVAVHGQADQWRLRRADQHRELLDRYAGATVFEPLLPFQSLYDEHVALSAELDRLRALSRDRTREVDLLRAGLEELERLDPRPGEDELLRAEDERLSHADGLREAAGLARAALTGDEDGPAGGSVPGVAEQVAAARAALGPMSGHDERLAAIDGRLAEIGYLAADVAGDLAAYLGSVESDPERLAAVQQRRAELRSLRRRYGDTVEDVLQWGRSAAARVDELEGAGDRAESVAARLSGLAPRLEELASRVSAARAAAADRLQAEATAELAALAMPSAVVTVAVTPRPPAAMPGEPAGSTTARLSRTGADQVEIQLAANPGSPSRAVASAASGGELSRVMLALEVVTGGDDVPTFVFDEVDAGVGGRAALAVGARLARLAEHAQVVVVTHLAQVAAYADRHLVVHKTAGGQVTASGVREVTGDDRLRELARMMAGSEDSPAAMEHARELLSDAAERRSAAAAGGPAAGVVATAAGSR